MRSLTPSPTGSRVIFGPSGRFHIPAPPALSRSVRPSACVPQHRGLTDFGGGQAHRSRSVRSVSVFFGRCAMGRKHDVEMSF